jgi:hypothetical protein
MFKLFGAIFILALTGCAGLPAAPPPGPSPCVLSEASYECQIERYKNVNET